MEQMHQTGGDDARQKACGGHGSVHVGVVEIRIHPFFLLYELAAVTDPDM